MELTARISTIEEQRPAEVACWEHLCQTEPHLASPFYSNAYCRAVADCRPNVLVAVISQARRPIAFFPFQFRSTVHKTFRFAECVGGNMTDYFGLVAPAGLRIDSQTLLRLCGLKYLYFTHLDEAQLTHGLTGENPETGFLLRVDPRGDYWEALKGIRREFVSETNRRERQIQRDLGPLRFCFQERDWRAPLAHLIESKRRQYTRTGSDNILDSGWRPRLLERLAANTAPGCQGVLSTLYAGKTWVASHFGLRNREVLHYWFPVYNPELRRYGPGTLILKSLTEAAPGLGIRVIDRGAGDGAHKRQIANAAHTFYRGAWAAAGLRGVLCRVACSARWRAGSLVQRCAGGFGRA